ncbi:hypothetical protein C2857_005304 [Epichloe festucae Fl1]|uniref:Monooxygenase n=1 Tax=Epichloe festucae (strain Fl1) TaxID=877507 RepID=A0A7S9KPG7_EPIFF|nr:hypothetical protein C2857_005304 [Epichloe festucae Fl1]
MARDIFTPMLAPVDEPKPGRMISTKTLFLKSILAQRRKCLLLAAVQLGITTLFPGRLAVVPPAALALIALAAHVVDKLTPSAPPPPAHMLSVVPGRATALLPLPDRDGGGGGGASRGSPVVVFNLGVQFNHPRGRLAPHARDLADKFARMNRDLLARRDELGLLSITNWTGAEAQQASGADGNTMLMSYYFRDVESIHRFAHEDMHRAAWDWYNSVKPHHIGIFHETFAVPAHGHETIYLNCRPFLLGAGLVKTQDGGETAWRNVLVSSDHVSLKTQWQRMNRDVNGVAI